MEDIGTCRKAASESEAAWIEFARSVQRASAASRAKARCRLKPHRGTEERSPVISCYDSENGTVWLEIRSDNRRNFFPLVGHARATRSRRGVVRSGDSALLPDTEDLRRESVRPRTSARVEETELAGAFSWRAAWATAGFFAGRKSPVPKIQAIDFAAYLALIKISRLAPLRGADSVDAPPFARWASGGRQPCPAGRARMSVSVLTAPLKILSFC